MFGTNDWLRWMFDTKPALLKAGFKLVKSDLNKNKIVVKYFWFACHFCVAALDGGH